MWIRPELDRLGFEPDRRAVGKPSVVGAEPEQQLLLAHDEGHAVVDRRHVGVRLGGHHGEAVAPPGAADQDDVLSRHAELVLTLDRPAGPWREVGLVLIRLEERGNGDDTAAVFHGFAPCRLPGALDARVEDDTRLP